MDGQTLLTYTGSAKRPCATVQEEGFCNVLKARKCYA